MCSTGLRRIAVLCIATFLATAAGAAPKVKRVQKLADDAGAPFHNILVVTLFPDFGGGKTLEKRIVGLLAERGTKSVASTSMMNTKTPQTPETYLALVDRTGADAVLVTQLVDVESDIEAKDANPQASVKFTSVFRFDLWGREVTEYVEPKLVTQKGEVLLVTQMFSVEKREAVWAIQSKLKFKMDVSEPRPYGAYDDESKSIVKYLVRDGLIAR